MDEESVAFDPKDLIHSFKYCSSIVPYIIIMSELADVVPSSNNHENENEPLDGGGTAALLVRYRLCRPTDIPVCAALEAASYPVDEAATTSTLQYRQHHAARYFWCAVVAAGGAFGSATTATTMTASEEPPDVAVEDCDDDTVIGFVCGTKCHTFTNESMSAHEPTGQLLAIHSVVVAEAYRKRKIATHMLQTYIQKIAAAKTEVEPDDQPITKIVLLSKAHLLAFYVICGFQVL